MKPSLIIVLLYFLGACTGSDTVADQRLAHWKSVLATEIPVGSNKENILEWCSNHNIECTVNYNGRMLFATLEEIEDENAICILPTILLGIHLDGKKSVKNRIKKGGLCP